MSDRDEFEKKFPVPDGIEWIDERQGYRITSDDDYWFDHEGQAHFRGFIGQWLGWQAARAQQAGSGQAGSLIGLSAFEVKALAMELHRTAGESSDGDDDYPLDVVICETVTDDNGKIGGPMLCIRDSDYPEEGVWPMPVSQQVRDRYTHPSASVPSDWIADIREAAKHIAEFESGPSQLAGALYRISDGLRSTPTTPQPADDFPLAISDVLNERKRQDRKWGGPEHDDQKSPNDFVQHIEDYAGWARVMAGMDSFDKYRRRMVQVAALAVAAVEATDRALKRPNPPVEQEGE